ncbi:MAG: twin-arginine translocase subunit TatB [Candidatus Electrothrix sp. AUS1_2]|nr:twin-arginine translocase subunit TatB [Candidatus Electrothrix sp. AUS1_2]
MFGIGLPEMIVILAVALIVVGPDKLPELARSLAKGVNELKKTMNQVKDSLNEETQVVSSVQRDLQQTAGQVKTRLLEEGIKHPNLWKQEGEKTPAQDDTDAPHDAEKNEIIEAEARPLRSREEGEKVSPLRRDNSEGDSGQASEKDSVEAPELAEDGIDDESREREVAENDDTTDTSATRPSPTA